MLLRIFLLTLFWALISKPVRSEEVTTDRIQFSGMTDDQRLILETTLNQLQSLRPGELKMNKRVYERLSRFKELFGFAFQGEALLDWFLSRIKKISHKNSWTVAVNQNKGSLILGDAFFKELNAVERLYLLIHEARHSDDNGYPHVQCPDDFKYISAHQPEMNLENEPACDHSKKGAYAFQAAFLFELYAYALLDQNRVGLLYNSSVARVIP